MHVCCGLVININNLGTHTYSNKPLLTSLTVEQQVGGGKGIAQTCWKMKPRLLATELQPIDNPPIATFLNDNYRSMRTKP